LKVNVAMRGGEAVLVEKKILYISSDALQEPTELHIMVEMLAQANDVVWISPYGVVNAPLFPSINKVSENLTIYYPGINFLALPFMRKLNEKRRLLQTMLYLLGRDFEPDLVIIDDYMSGNFAAYYGKRGVLTLYYRISKYLDEQERPARRKVEAEADLVYKPAELAEELSEEELLAALRERLEDISALVEAKSEYKH
jgi:hypothetical protein